MKQHNRRTKPIWGGQAPGTRQDEFQTDDDWILGVLYELDQLHKPREEAPEVEEQYIPHENPVIESGNQFMDTMGWIGGILGSTVDTLSGFDTTDDSPYATTWQH